MRTTKPEAGNKYYIRKVSGGWNGAVQGKPTDVCNVLANCVGYANGRFAEIMGEFKYQFISNAENFIEHAKSYGLEVGQTPRVGAIMCWQKGTLSSSDGAGHVAIVERVNSDGSVYTSESGYNSKAFWNSTRTNANGRWGQNSSYSFRGFIYNPNVKPEPVNRTQTLQSALNSCGANLVVDGSYGKLTTNAVKKYYNTKTIIKWVQENLNSLGYNCGTVDGYRGTNTKNGTKAFQKARGLSVDGIAGPNTIKEICK